MQVLLRRLAGSSRELQVIPTASADNEDCHSHVLQELHGFRDVVTGETICHPNQHLGNIWPGTSSITEELLLGVGERLACVSVTHELPSVPDGLLHSPAGQVPVKGELHGGCRADVDDAGLDILGAKGERPQKVPYEFLDLGKLIVGDAARAVQQEEEVALGIGNRWLGTYRGREGVVLVKWCEPSSVILCPISEFGEDFAG